MNDDMMDKFDKIMSMYDKKKNGPPNKDLINMFVKQLQLDHTTPRILLTKYLPLCIADRQRWAIREALVIYNNN